jgi:hypothetical protein
VGFEPMGAFLVHSSASREYHLAQGEARMKKPIDSEFWAQRAAEASQTARSMRSPMAKRAMERLAANYEALARKPPCEALRSLPKPRIDGPSPDEAAQGLYSRRSSGHSFA